MATFHFNRDSLINFHQTLNILFEEELSRNEKIRTIMFTSLRKIRIMTYIYLAAMIILTMMILIPAYLLIIRDLCHLTTNENIIIEKGYGYSVPHYLYHLNLFFVITLRLVCNLITISVDAAFGFYVYYFTSTMQAMTFRMMNSLPSEKNVLRTCVAKHQKLLQCRNTLEHIYEKIIFWHIVTNAIVLCGVLYQLVPVCRHVNVEIDVQFTNV